MNLCLEAHPARIAGDTVLLEQALNNLLSNALRYTPQGSVTIISGESDDHIFLEVRDTGSGLSEPHREGLGLRVVRAVATAHHATLTFKREKETQVRLAFPREPNKELTI